MPDSFERVLTLNGVEMPRGELGRLRGWLNYDGILNRDYSWGYVSALIDVVDFLESDIVPDLFKYCGVPRNHKTVCKLFQFLLMNRNLLRKGSDACWIGYDKTAGEFYIRRVE